ncbi:MAG: O-antigen ligase family protein [Rhizobiales bacterium]|nr:O-antigen ligase family protein [Hyphomicrobiales bacterium]OJY06418.1 MAG: polymerase [Rhizobiales bacterium 63-22]
MKSFKKQFLFRRRFDAWALGVAAASMPVRIGLGPLILFVFSCLGIYISSARHSVARLFCKKFYIFILLYAAWSLGLILYRHEPFHENRQIGYTLLVAIFAFGGPGMALIRDPLKAYVLGSRVGIILAAVVAVFLAMTAGGRIGVGGNQAVFAFLAGVTAVSASIPVRAAPRWLPNGPHWLVLGLAAILPSETRAVIVVIPFFAVVEIILFMRRFNIRQQGAVYAALIAALVALVVVGPVGTIISNRFTGMIEYYDTGNSADWEDKISADIREAMWQSAVKIIAHHPIAGVGGYAKMADVRAEAGNKAYLLKGFLHVHNTILDELLNDGIIGLFFMMSGFLSIFIHLWRTASSWAMRRALLCYAAICGSYGMLHNPLLHEMTISSTMFFLAVLNAAASRRIMAARRAGLETYMFGRHTGP